MQPLVTVNILSYNRKDDLRSTLQKVSEQDYKNTEVIVVDNNSRDGSVEMVKSEFPSVLLLELQKNIGIAGWNEGAKIAKGEYLLFLDDDSYPARNTLTKVIKDCISSTIVALDVRLPGGQPYGSCFSERNRLNTFIGCGVLISRKLFENIGGFESSLFLYHHEIEFCMRALHRGYTIRYVPDAVVVHECSQIHRSAFGKYQLDRRRQYYMNRNAIIILLLRFPFYKVVGRILRIFAGRLLFAFFRRCFFIVLQGLLAGVIVSIRQWNKRSVISRDVQLFYDNGRCMGSFFADGVYGFQRPSWF